MRDEMRRAVELMGPGRLRVEAKKDFVSRGLSPGLTLDDAEELRARLPGLYMVYPTAQRYGTDLWHRGRRYEDLELEGIWPDWRKRDWVYTLRGRFLDETDVRSAARVCVLIEPGGWIEKPFWAKFWRDDNAYEGFIRRTDLLGHEVRLGERGFKVVGVLQEPPKDRDPRWSRDWGGNGTVLIPVTTFLRAFPPEGQGGRSPRAVSQIALDTGDEATVAAVKRKVEEVLKRRHRGEEDFEVKDHREEIQSELKETAQYTFVAIALGAVAILAGGIGIMNVTLATIFSRVKEIGIRRAVGAERSDIVAQFVAEAVLLGLCGGVAGIGLGLGLLRWLARQAERDLTSLSWEHFVLALGLAGGTGLLFSFWPAWRASALDPVEALRAE